MESSQGKHILGTFEAALSGLRDDVLVMGSLTARNLTNAVNGLIKRDNHLCTLVIADDEELDELEKKVDGDGFALMVRFQPVASDLREVISAMKISTNLERVGDQAVSIARRARKLNRYPELAETAMLRPIFTEALAMLNDSLTAYSDGNAGFVNELKARDRMLDMKCKEYDRTLSNRMAETPDHIRGMLNLVFVSRALERVGDHATNISEDAAYLASGADVRHIKAV